MKYTNFEISFKDLVFNVKLLDDSAVFPNTDKEDKLLHEEFKVVVRNGNKEINFKFYNSAMERDISEYIKNLCHLPFSIREFKTIMTKKFMWGGYDKVKSLNDLQNERIKSLFYAILNDLAINLENDLSSFKEFCDNFGYDSDSRTAEKIYNSCLEQQDKIYSLGLTDKQTKYFTKEVAQETERFSEDIKNILI